MSIIQTALIDSGDPFAPAISRPEAQKWDSYQTHDLYCEDIFYQQLEVRNRVVMPPEAVKFKSFLAVEKCSINEAISFDFESIALLYP